MKIIDNFKNQVLLAIIWLVFTVALATWWFIFALRLIKQLALIDLSASAEILRKNHMIYWEGSILIMTLLVGGAVLLYLIFREKKRADQTKNFFSSFSHEIKTSIMSFQLQVESMQGELGSKTKKLNRMLSDALRLRMQLENSLFYANIDKSKVRKEEVFLSEFISAIHYYWPEVEIKLSKNEKVLVDKKLFESVLKNIIHNSIHHGKAETIIIDSSNNTLFIDDDGQGYEGDYSELGREPTLSSSKGGSGLGIFLSRQLMEEMGGKLYCEKGPNEGFRVTLQMRRT